MNILITAGPTREKIDPVRFITNYSSGKMGYALAEAALLDGHDVTLISGPVSIAAPDGVKLVRVESAAEMASAVHAHAPAADMLIMAAAVADYRPVNQLAGKMKKSPGNLILELERTEDILGTIGANRRPEQILVGFAAETEDLEENAIGKLKRKNLDWIAANMAADGFNTDTNRIVLFNRDGKKLILPIDQKINIAKKMLKEIIG